MSSGELILYHEDPLCLHIVRSAEAERGTVLTDVPCPSKWLSTIRRLYSENVASGDPCTLQCVNHERTYHFAQMLNFETVVSTMTNDGTNDHLNAAAKLTCQSCISSFYKNEANQDFCGSLKESTDFCRICLRPWIPGLTCRVRLQATSRVPQKNKRGRYRHVRKVESYLEHAKLKVPNFSPSLSKYLVYACLNCNNKSIFHVNLNEKLQDSSETSLNPNDLTRCKNLTILREQNKAKNEAGSPYTLSLANFLL